MTGQVVASPRLANSSSQARKCRQIFVTVRVYTLEPCPESRGNSESDRDDDHCKAGPARLERLHTDNNPLDDRTDRS
jgi:hypothetical protein